MELLAFGGVPYDLGLGAAHAELAQDVGAADDSAVTALMLWTVALAVVERRVPGDLANLQRRLTVGQHAWRDRNRDGCLAEPAGVFRRRFAPWFAGIHRSSPSPRSRRSAPSRSWPPSDQMRIQPRKHLRGGDLCYRPTAAVYCSTTLAGMRPRPLTARPCSL